jgi:hypothetical protein
MATQAELRMNVRATGTDLQTIARKLRKMDDARVTELFRRKLEEAAGPVARRVQASALAIPVKDPERVPVLRPKIADTVDVSSWADVGNRQAGAAVFVNTAKMPARERALPLYMEGAKPRWRHPVFGRRANPNDWQPQAPHPYFYGPARSFGPAAGEALKRAMDEVTRKLS